VSSKTRIMIVAGLLQATLSVHLVSQVRTGADMLIRGKLDLLQGKNVGLITNHTGRLGTGEPLVDALIRGGVHVVRLFGPEHGIWGMADAGETVADSVDGRTGIPIISLYGKSRKPTAEMLKGVDLLLYDIQDVGARFYTYVSTMALCMEAAAEEKIPFIVLDRPNPLGGERLDGPVLEDSLRSFVGIAPLPIVYGLTCGELARLLNGEHLLGGGVQAELTVVPMEGWDRSMLWSGTKLDWIPPSPNLRTAESALAYPGTCLVEATNVSEGRGTEKPFLTLGAPFVNGSELAEALEAEHLPGVAFQATSFVPSASKHAGKTCGGVVISIIDDADFSPVKTGLTILVTLQRLYPREFRVQKRSFERLYGSRGVYEELFEDGGAGSEAGGGVSRIERMGRLLRDGLPEVERFRLLSLKYRLYTE
jgi:uncharacterized protein YbbC (DUF1343 family)